MNASAPSLPRSPLALPRRAARQVALSLLLLLVLAGCQPPAPRPPADPCPLGAHVTPGAAPEPDGPPALPRKEAWLAEHPDPNGRQEALRQRLAGWPAVPLADRATLPADDEAFARRLAADTWRGLWALRDTTNGLPLDNIGLAPGRVTVTDARIGDYTTPTNIGLFLMAATVAPDLGLEGREACLGAIRQILDTLERLPTWEGFFFNYYDTTSLEPSSHFVSFVDSAWLTAGLILVRQTFPELAARAGRLVEAGNFARFYDDGLHQMCHGVHTRAGRLSTYHYGALYTEARLGSLIAIGKGDVPVAHWFGMVRTYPPSCGWQSLPPQDARIETVRGESVHAGHYDWRGVRFVPSWGGSMFEALMPTLLVDEARLAPASFGENGRAHVTVQQRYAREVLGDPVWGQSPSMAPGSGGYRAFGIPVLGSEGYRPGAVTPHAAALAVGVDATAAFANLRELARRYDLYGDFGFYDAVDPRSGEVATSYLVLDQAMIFLPLANHLGDGVLQKRFAADPVARRALPLVREERFFR